MDELASLALQHGEEQANLVLGFRDEALRRRAAVLEQVQESAAGIQALEAEGASLLAERIGAAPPRAVLVAEGDSWFDYPWNDVLEILEDDHGYDVESVAHKGDTIEEMAYVNGQLEELTRRIEKVLRRGHIPRAILLSGGGNDVAGSEFRTLLNHASSPAPGLNTQAVIGIIDQRIRPAFLTIIAAVTRICEQRLQQRIPIILHGYDYPVPDGRGFWGGWWFLPGPWLEPGFRVKGYMNLPQRIEIARDLIDRYNTMVERLPVDANLPHVRYVNLRGTLSVANDYRDWWDNELHPTRRGFLAVTQKIAAAIP